MGAIVLVSIVATYVAIGAVWFWYGTHDLPAWWLRPAFRSAPGATHRDGEVSS